MGSLGLRVNIQEKKKSQIIVTKLIKDANNVIEIIVIEVE